LAPRSSDAALSFLFPTNFQVINDARDAFGVACERHRAIVFGL
jgi:hypothetical protein